MKILILGGTKFIGRHIVEGLRAAGHNVSIFSRGTSPDALPADVERLRGDRDQGSYGLSALTHRSWDVCVDVCGYTPRQVRASAELLRAKVERYIFVSTVSVYADSTVGPVGETQARVSAAGEDVTVVNGETYGPLKVTCENIVQQVYAHQGTLLRPQIVAGPYDHTGRYEYWVQRAARGGAMLAPGDGSDYLQVIDARDLAGFVKILVECNAGGAFNLAGPRISWADFITMLGAKNIVWVSAGMLQSAGLTPVELPLFIPRGSAGCGFMNVSNDLARAAGLTLTDPELTLRDFRTWIENRPFAPTLAPEREAELIRSV